MTERSETILRNSLFDILRFRGSLLMVSQEASSQPLIYPFPRPSHYIFSRPSICR